jgi:hypothetical protein
MQTISALMTLTLMTAVIAGAAAADQPALAEAVFYVA